MVLSCLVWQIVLVRLRLHKVDLFTLLLRHGYIHCSTEVTTLEVAEKLYSMPHELVHWHESGFLEVRSQQISWLPIFRNQVTASR
jgi:hypothetical protein